MTGHNIWSVVIPARRLEPITRANEKPSTYATLFRQQSLVYINSVTIVLYEIGVQTKYMHNTYILLLKKSGFQPVLDVITPVRLYPCIHVNFKD